MAIDPNVDITLVFGWLKDLSIIITVSLVGWKARGAFQPAIDFVKDVQEFMKETRQFMIVVQANHLKHIEQYLAKLSGTEVRDDSFDPQV